MKRAAFVLISFACACTTPAEEPSGSGGSTSASGGANGLPCDIDAVLRARCQACHAAAPKYGAPMPLVTLDDLHAPAVSDPSRAVFELIPSRLDDKTSPMPPSAPLASDERATLDAWLAEGAPAGAESNCGGGGGGGGGGAPPVGVGDLPCTPTHTFVAHASGANDAFHVPESGADNLYQCFTFASPFSNVTQATAWAPIIDDERVLHHWILYRTKTPQADGAVMPCQMPADATFVAGWAPGGKNFVAPDDVGVELGGTNNWYILQMHYHNTAHHADALDASGVALCTTETPRKYDAGIYTLGSVNINIPAHASGYQTSGMCPSSITSFLPEPVHIITSSPHMHELGRTVRTEIFRGSDNGPMETLVSVDPWVFDNQSYYVHEPAIVFNPGDAIRTTCTYDNPTNSTVKFGEKTEDEMCFNFVMLYPISLIQGDRQCGLF